ncbi:MAG: hypothetical protein MUQ00_11050 [Candidatus Aminicenantes bacterium]|nr:hypothetical protein [Candidatus Aminicenantes bacterium]
MISSDDALRKDGMKKRVWMAIGLISAAAPLQILLGEGHGLPPAEKWVARYNGPGNDEDSSLALAVDKSGNVSSTGESFGKQTGVDFATVKYSPNGKQL